MATKDSVALIGFFISVILVFGIDVSSMDIDDGVQALCMAGSTFPHNNSGGNGSTVVTKCERFYESYVKYAGEFTVCELNYSRPFRICNQCLVQRELTFITYQDFSTDEDLSDCRKDYMKADRVQVIPSMQTYIESVWKDAACTGCTENVQINHCTGKVNFTVPWNAVYFMELFRNLSVCMNTSLEDGNVKLYEYTIADLEQNTSVCRDCQKEYNQINDHYNSMSGASDGDICMDIVDRMNYTRLIWSHRFGCSCRSGDSPPVITIAVIIGVLPIGFYGVLRYRGKKTKSKVVKQKRLASHSIAQLSQSLTDSIRIEGTPNSSSSLTT